MSLQLAHKARQSFNSQRNVSLSERAVPRAVSTASWRDNSEIERNAEIVTGLDKLRLNIHGATHGARNFTLKKGGDTCLQVALTPAILYLRLGDSLGAGGGGGGPGDLG
jgi:hypothetical protein